MDDFLLDTELLELKHDLSDHLADHGYLYFQHYTQIETDLSNGEIKVELMCEYNEEVKKVFLDFARRHGFKRLFFSKHKGAMYLRRRARKK